MKNLIVLFTSLILLLLPSCASRKNIVYLDDMEMGKNYSFDARHEAVVHRDDRLSITVSGKNPELAIPFNSQGGIFKVGTDGDITSSSLPVEQIREKGYRVDVDGNINFPILGKLHVEGLRVSQVTDLIKTKIIEGNYMKDPLVSLEFLNFKYTVLGAVGRNGTFTVNGDRITLLEAIANAGDLTQAAKIDRVTVIREIGNERKKFMHDLRSKDLFESPCFYLQQNDIVYVEPKYKRNEKVDRGFQVTTVLLSIVSAVCSVIWATRR